MHSVQSAWARHTGQCLSGNAFRQPTCNRAFTRPILLFRLFPEELLDELIMEIERDQT